MHAAVRPCVSAGAILAVSSVIAATPIAAPPPPDVAISGAAVRLAADSIANVPINLFYALANVPYYEVQALNSWSDALQAGGSWWLKTPTNAWGWDPGNPPMIEALVAVLVPFPVISGNGGLPAGADPANGIPGPQGVVDGVSWYGGSAPPGTLGYILNIVAAAELPMHEGCGFTCDDVLTALGGYFQVPLSDLFDGYTFGEITNPNNEEGQIPVTVLPFFHVKEGANPYPNPYPVAWSGETIPPIDPMEPFTNFWASLVADPSDPDSQAAAGLKVPSLGDVVHTGIRLQESGVAAFASLFPGSYLFTGFPLYDADILLGGLIRGIIERSCPTCGDLTPPAVTSVPSPDARSVNINAAPATPSTDVQEHVTTGTQTAQRSVAPAETTASTFAPKAEPVVQTVPATQQLPDPQPVVQSAPAAEVVKPTTTTSTVGTREENTVESGGTTGGTSGGRLSSVVKSVGDRINSTVSRVTDRLSGGGSRNAGSTGESSGAGGDSGTSGGGTTSGGGSGSGSEAGE